MEVAGPLGTPLGLVPKQETQEMQVRSLGREDPLEEGMATHSSILAWRIPGTEEPGGLQSTGLQSRARLSTPSSGPQESLQEREGKFPQMRWLPEKKVAFPRL